jgi:hypothetical protein
MKIAKMTLFVTYVLLSCISIIFAQIRQAEFEIHDRGMLWETVKDDGTIGAPNPTNQYEFFPSMDWPGGPHTLPLKDEQRSYMVGSGMWIGGKHQDGTLFFTEHGPFSLVDEGTFEGIEKTENYLESSDYNPAEAEQVISAAWITSENIRVERTSRAWSFLGINNFLIIEYLLTNQNSTAVNDFYVGFPSLIRPSYQDILVHNGWGDDFNRSDELVAYDTTRALLYAYDNTPNFDLPTDVGNWWEEVDEMRTPGYAGYALLYADPASNGSPQPSNILYAQLLDNTNKLTLNSTSKENLYAILNGTDRSLQAQAEERIVPFMLMSCGPYTLTPSQALRIVLVEAVDGLPIEEAIKGLSVQPNLPQGLGLLQGTVDRARDLFLNNYQVIALSPPSPEIEVIPIPSDQSISISWFGIDSTWVNPISGKANFKEYRIYRSERTFIGPYERIRVIRPLSPSHIRDYFDEREGKWVYKDRDIQLGVSYYYAVTSRDSVGEESFLTNRIEEPVKAANPPAPDAMNVIVFPNPFREKSGFPTPGEGNSIVWTNLPARCTIRIYTSSGEIVRTLEHDNPNIGEEVWDQLNDARQKTAPGIYFWTVASDVGNAKGTLLLIK